MNDSGGKLYNDCSSLEIGNFKAEEMKQLRAVLSEKCKAYRKIDWKFEIMYQIMNLVSFRIEPQYPEQNLLTKTSSDQILLLGSSHLNPT